MKSRPGFLLLAAAIFCCGATKEDIPELIEGARQASSTNMRTAARKILAIDPNNGNAYAIKGCAEYFDADRDGCIADCAKAIKLHPQDPFWERTALNYSYHCYIDHKDWKNALSLCLQCLKVEPTPGVAHDAALLSRLNGDHAGAVHYAQLASKYGDAQEHMIHTMSRQGGSPIDPRVDVPGLTNAEKATADQMQSLVRVLDRGQEDERLAMINDRGAQRELEQILAKIKDPSHLRRIIANVNSSLTTSGLRISIESSAKGTLSLERYNRSSHRFEKFQTIGPAKAP